LRTTSFHCTTWLLDTEKLSAALDVLGVWSSKVESRAFPSCLS
jgi:hypothetical protein